MGQPKHVKTLKPWSCNQWMQNGNSSYSSPKWKDRGLPPFHDSADFSRVAPCHEAPPHQCSGCDGTPFSRACTPWLSGSERSQRCRPWHPKKISCGGTGVKKCWHPRNTTKLMAKLSALLAMNLKCYETKQQNLNYLKLCVVLCVRNFHQYRDRDIFPDIFQQDLVQVAWTQSSHSPA